MALLLSQRRTTIIFKIWCFRLDFWDERHAWSDEDIFRDIQSVQNEGKNTCMQIACGLTWFQYLMNKRQQILMKPDKAPSGVSCKLFMNTDSAVLYSAELHSYKIMKMFKAKVIIWVLLLLCMCSGYGKIKKHVTKQPISVIWSVWRKLSRICTHTVTSMMASHLWKACL